jgi:type IV pilus assembly protein PilX
MNSSLPLPLRFGRRQRGVALITGLIFLVVLTLLAITAARMSGLEERMSGNMRDRSLAVQAAEMALRDAERDIRTSGRFGVFGIAGVPAGGGCFNAFCYNSKTGAKNGDDWNVTPVWSLFSMTAGPSAAYGQYTGLANIAGLSAQPRYLIEGLQKLPPGNSAPVSYYRITVRALGANPNTVVWLQEVFRPI